MKYITIFFLVTCILFTSFPGLSYENNPKGIAEKVTPAEYTSAITKNFNGHTYSLFLDISISWEEARDYCTSIGGHLATVTSGEEHNFVSSMDNGNPHNVWIGGYRDNRFVWHWVTDEEWNYTNWQKGEPNNSEDENCVALWPDQWNDLNSENLDEQYGFICEWDEVFDDGEDIPVKPDIPSNGKYTPSVTKNFNGHTYSLFLDISISWEEAREYCISIGGHLATVTSQEEHDFVSTMDYGQSHDVWIGGYRDSSFVWYWVTDEEWDYTNWQEGEPNNSSNVVGNEYCAALWPDQWNDLNSENLIEQDGFICEWDDLTDDGQGVPDGLDKPLDEKVSPLSVVTYDGHTYKLFDNKLQWTEARAYCESIGGHLATVTSEAENELITSLMENGSCDGYWLGAGAGSNGWMWITEEDFYGYVNFADSVEDCYETVHYMQIANNSEKIDRGQWFATGNCDEGDRNTEDEKIISAGNVGFICEWDDFIANGNIEISSVKIESNDNKIKIDIDYDATSAAVSFATLCGGSFTSPKNMESGSAEFDNVEGDKKYTVKMFFWDENLRPLSKPVETEIFVK